MRLELTVLRVIKSVLIYLLFFMITLGLWSGSYIYLIRQPGFPFGLWSFLSVGLVWVILMTWVFERYQKRRRRDE